MAEIRVHLDAAPSPEQIAFVETSVRNSFRIASFDWTSDDVVIVHEEADSADTMATMVRRFVFIAKNIDKDLVFHNDVPIRCSDMPAASASSGQGTKSS